MNRRRRKTIGALAAVLALGLLPSSGAMASNLTERTQTELGQAVNEPTVSNGATGSLDSRTPTELGQRVYPPRHCPSPRRAGSTGATRRSAGAGW